MLTGCFLDHEVKAETPHLCGDSTLHYADVEVRRGSFVHLHAAVGDHKHGAVGELDVGGSQRLELYQLCLTHTTQSCLSRALVSGHLVGRL